MKKLVWLIVIILIIWAIFALMGGDNAGNEVSTDGPIKIGFIGPLSGFAASIGENAKAAVEIAVEEINADGGIDGRELQVIYEDGQCDGIGATNAINKLLNVHNVPVVIGGACSPETVASAAVSEESKIPQLSYCSTAPAISDAGDYIFRNVPSDLFQAKFAADYLYNDLGKRKAAIVFMNQDWGVGIKDAFNSAFTELGGEVVIIEAYNPESSDIRAQMTKVAASDVDVLYFPSFIEGAVPGIKQAKELGVEITIFGADAWDDPKVWTELGSIADGVLFAAGSTNSSEEFKSKMFEKVGTDEIVYCSNYVYDAINIVAKVLEDVGTDPEKIKDALYDVEHTGGVSQPVIKFDENGDPSVAEYTLKTVRGGQIETVE